MSPQPPKTTTDEKMEQHFNGITLTVLAVIALAILIAIIFFFERGSKAAPSTHRQNAQMSSRTETGLMGRRKPEYLCRNMRCSLAHGDGIHLKCL